MDQVLMFFSDLINLNEASKKLRIRISFEKKMSQMEIKDF